MTPFARLSILTQNLVCFWALLLCLSGAAGGMLLWRQKRRLLCALSGFCFLCAYFILQVCRDGTEQRLHGCGDALAERVLRMPCAAFFAALALLSAICCLLFRDVLRWRRAHITSDSIKESMDGLPAGVCYYLEDGRCILVNHRMNDICVSLLGQPLQNGVAFRDAVRDRPVCLLPDGTAVSFRHRAVTYEGAPAHELIANDITELYNKSRQLRADNERELRLKADMKAYGATIADTVQKQEILQAKVNIHDGMNRMILATQRAAEDGAAGAQRGEVLRMWQSQALLLCKEADARRSSSVVSDLNALAAVIGLRLEWDGAPETDDPAALSLFLHAAREAMANAAKHAKAERLAIHIEENGGSLRAAFENERQAAEAPAEERGGLAELRRRVEGAGGEMKIDAGSLFRLSVSIPKGGTANAVSGIDRGGSGDAAPAF